MLRRLFFSRPMQILGRCAIYISGALGLLLAFGITLLIIVQGLPLFLEQGPAAVLLGREWRPHSGKFGMLPLILSTLYSMLGGLLLSVPFAVLTALFIYGFLSPRLQGVCYNLIMTLARIPSIIYGLLGIVWLMPTLQRTFHMTTGFSLLAVILVLAGMLLPQVLVALLDALRKLPPQTTKISSALGATDAETLFYVALPHIKRDILVATVRAASCAVGETIVIAMVAGSIARFPSLLEPASTLALEASGTFVGLDGETGRALFAVALVLLVIVALLGVLRWLAERWRKGQ